MPNESTETVTDVRYRCEGCGAFLKPQEIGDDDSHTMTEYDKDGSCYPVLCGPVGKAAWHD